MTSDDQNLQPKEPTRPVPIVPATPVAPEPETSPPPGGPRLGHVVLGAILVLIGVGWLLEALDVADVPWRFLLPAALIIVGVALVFGARTGSHGGLVAVGVVLTVLVLLAGAIDALLDIPFAGGVGDESLRPTSTVEDEYRWGVGKLTIDLRDAEGLATASVQASVVVGELTVIVPKNVTFRVTAHSGVGEVIVLGQQSGGFDARLECLAAAGSLTCSGDFEGPPMLNLDLEAGMGKVEVTR